MLCCFQGLEIDDRMREELEACIGQLEAERELPSRVSACQLTFRHVPAQPSQLS